MKSSATETNLMDKIEFATPLVNADLSQSLGWWFVQASWTYLHFTNTQKKKKKKKKIVTIVSQKKKKTKLLHPFTPKTIWGEN